MKTKTLFVLTDIFLYIFAGIATYFFVMVLFTDAINDFRAFLDYLPLYLTLILPVYALIAVNRISKVQSDNLKLRKIKINTLVFTAISFLAFIYGFINTFVSFGGDFIAGGPSKYFPLSFLLLDVAFMGVGAYILYLFKNEKCEAESAPINSAGRITLDVFKHLYILLALYFLGTFAFGFYSFDLSLEHVVGTLPIYLLMIVPSAMIIALEIIKGSTSFHNVNKARFITGLCGLGLSVVLGVWASVYMSIKPNFVVDALTASFPLDFAISVNLGPILLIILGVVLPLYIVISHLLLSYCPVCKRRAAKKDQSSDRL